MELPGRYTPPQSISRSSSPERTNRDPSMDIMVQITRASEILPHHVAVDINEADDAVSVGLERDPLIAEMHLEGNRPEPPVQQEVPTQQADAPAPAPNSIRSILIGPPHSLGLWIGRGIWWGGLSVGIGGVLASAITGSTEVGIPMLASGIAFSMTGGFSLAWQHWHLVAPVAPAGAPPPPPMRAF
jgi:hypothetical protein